MKKSLVILAIFIMIILPVSATSATHLGEEKYADDVAGWWSGLWEGAHFSYDGYFRSALLRDNPTLGGGLSLGVETNMFKFESYAQADYFMAPLGGEGGAAALEFTWEAGINLNWKFLQFWGFNVWAACDIGYFGQMVKGFSYPPYDSYMLGANGLIIRPKLMTELKIAKYYGLTLGVFYQLPVYPAYADYNGLGIVFSIM